jgi:hypothetical protein
VGSIVVMGPVFANIAVDVIEVFRWLARHPGTVQ